MNNKEEMCETFGIRRPNLTNRIPDINRMGGELLALFDKSV